MSCRRVLHCTAQLPITIVCATRRPDHHMRGTKLVDYPELCWGLEYRTLAHLALAGDDGRWR